MDPFFKQDIFFFITSAAVIIVGLLVSILIVYLIKIAKDVKYITLKAKNQADIIGEELSDLRDNIKEKGAAVSHWVSFFNNVYKKSSKNKKKLNDD